jgi:imidazolonepropionase-like amidohydrolase
MRMLGLLLVLAATPVAAQTIAVTHAEAWTMATAAPVKDATILIENGRIVSVTAGGGVPQGATVIDAKGKPVTPGFMNAATQVGLVEVNSASATRDQGSADERNPGFDPARALNGNSTLVDLIRADGITRAFLYPAPSRQPVFAGEPVMAHYRDGVDILDRREAAVFVVIGGGAWDRIGSRAQQWTVLRKALTDAKGAMAAVDAAKGKGKHGGPPPGRGRRGGGDPMRGVIAGEVPLAIHTNRESDIRQAIALAADFGIRVVIVEGVEAWRAADALAAAKIPVVLDPSVNLPGSFDELGARQDNAAILARAGVPIAFGMAGGKIHMTYNAGLALREGAGIAVANGLPWIEGLRAVTVNPQAIWAAGTGADGPDAHRGAGTLTPGAEADLVVWDGDPLEPSTNAVAVIVEGRQAGIRSRQDQLAERYKDAR